MGFYIQTMYKDKREKKRREDVFDVRLIQPCPRPTSCDVPLEKTVENIVVAETLAVVEISVHK